MSLLASENRVPAPSGYTSKHWLEESIWGHRLWHRQTPWLIFLELLTVAAGRAKAGRPFGSTPHFTVDSFPARQRRLLRHLLYRNSEIAMYAAKQRPDAELWDAWIKYFSEQQDENKQIDVSFLRTRFARFRDFASAVKLLRETTVYPAGTATEAASERRWTSFFVFPFGEPAIYEDLDVDFVRDTSRFGRTGDIVYQMLARSKHATALKPVVDGFLNTSRQVTRLVAKLQDPGADQWTQEDRTGSYLPYKSHPAYDRLAEDWLKIHQLNLAGYDAYQHYVTLGALHVLIYHLETAAAWADWPRVHFICEVLGPRTPVRRLSIESFQQNEGATMLALAGAWKRLTGGAEFKAMLTASQGLPEEDRIAEARDFLHRRLRLPEDEHVVAGTIDDLLASVWSSIESKAEDNLTLLHRAYGRSCGLVSRRGARQYRYAPTDLFLKTIVLATVDRRLELREFLHLLFERYHLVFGPNEANLVRGEADFEGTVFEKNARRLEERLKSMGMLNRLSDGVAFVENPHRAS